MPPKDMGKERGSNSKAKKDSKALFLPFLTLIVGACISVLFLISNPVRACETEEHCDTTITPWHVGSYGFLSAISTGLGVLPFLFVRSIPRWWLGVSHCIAAGMMLAASIGLVHEGMTIEPVDTSPGIYEHPAARTLFGVIVGLVFILVSKNFLDQADDLKVAGMTGLDARRTVLLVAVMTLHSFSEGVGIGVSFGGSGGHRLGPLISTTLTIHNVPEGLAVALVLIPRGVGVMSTCIWCIVTSLPQPLMALPAYAFVEYAQAFLPVGLGFAAGAMFWMVMTDMIQEAREDIKNELLMLTIIAMAAGSMGSIQYLLG